jgi:hypothetical protein
MLGLVLGIFALIGIIAVLVVIGGSKGGDE